MDSTLKNKNVILLTIDALRADHLKSYGYNRNTAPNLEKFIKNATIFFNCYTNGPETPSSFSAIFTSILPFLEGGYSPLPSQKITLTQLLKEHGIHTYAIHSNPNLGRFFNYDRGFDTFLDGERYKPKKDMQMSLNFTQKLSLHLNKFLDIKQLSKKLLYKLKGFNKIKFWLRDKIPALTDLLLPFSSIAYNAPYITDKIISFLNQKKPPFFLWAHFMDIHSPYNPPSKNVLNFRKEDFSLKQREFLTSKVYIMHHNPEVTPKMIDDLKLLYDSEINYLDEYLGKLFKYIQFHFKKNCLIIITADHGENFYEHSIFGHQGSIYDELLRVPLFIIEMGKKPNRRQIHDTIELLDISPTILDYFDIAIPEFFQGRTILPLLHGESLKELDYIISECYQKNGQLKRNNEEGFKLLSIKSDLWKYIYDEEKNLELLFNLELDPIEKNNIIKDLPEKALEFRMIRDTHFQRALALDEKAKIIKAIKTDKLDL
ncbi:MAG: sulfatase [Promethearchaeota archaeon]